MVVREPVQEVRRLGNLRGSHTLGRAVPEFGNDVDQAVLQFRPVVDGVADVAERALKGLLQFSEVARCSDPVDLDVHPGLA